MEAISNSVASMCLLAVDRGENMKKRFQNINLISVLYKMAIFWFLIGYIVIPIFYTLSEAVTLDSVKDWRVFLEFFVDAKNQQVLFNTLKLGILTVLICGTIGVSLAFFMTYHCTRLKKFIHLVFLTPMMVPGIIIVIAYLQLYGETGIITTLLCHIFKMEEAPYSLRGFGGVVFVHALTQYVHFYLQTYIALKYVDYSEIEVARGLGASKMRIFIDVILPAIKPALILSSTMTFISGISSYAAPSILGNGFRVLSTQIATAKANYDFQRASLNAIILFGFGFVILMISQYSNSKKRRKRNLRAVQYVQKNPTKLTIGRIVEYIFVGILVCLILLPNVGIIYLSLVDNQAIMTELIPHEFTIANYLSVFQSRRTLDPFVNSLKMAGFVVIVGCICTVPLSYMVSKKKSFVNNLAWFLVTLSWSIPGSVLAVNLITAFNTPNIFSFGTTLIGGFYILPIAYTINTLPMMMNNNMIAMENFNPALEDASRGLGAGRTTTFVKVILPNVLPGIISGCMLSVINTLGEYTISNLIYGVHNQPISIAMLKRFTNYEFGDTMAYAAVIILICSFLFLMVFKMDKKNYF